MPTILIADNNPDFAESVKWSLEKEGFEVALASDPTTAKKCVKERNIDLILLDIRLMNDMDEKDRSGLVLARELGHKIPIIMFTGFPAYEAVREALMPQLDGLSPAVDFVPKSEAPQACLQAIRKALELTSERKQKEAYEKRKKLFKRELPILALVALSLAMTSGLIGAISQNPYWLIGTFLLALVFAIFASLSTMKIDKP